MPLIVKNRRYLWLPLLAALIPFLLVSAVTFATVITGEATHDEAALPFVALSFIALGILVIMGVPILLLVAFERRAILRLIERDYWARWPQYASEAEWRAFAEREHQREIAANRLPWVMFIFLIILFSFISGFTLNMMKSDDTNFLVIAAPLGIMFTIILMISMGGPLLARRQSHAHYSRRLRAPVPAIYIGKRGLYDEDNGYQTFNSFNVRLTTVRYRAGNPGEMQFSMRVQMRYQSINQAIPVVVPPRKEIEAETLLQRLMSEGVVPSNGVKRL